MPLEAKELLNYKVYFRIESRYKKAEKIHISCNNISFHVIYIIEEEVKKI